MFPIVALNGQGRIWSGLTALILWCRFWKETSSVWVRMIGGSLSRAQLENFGRQAMESLATIHKVSVEEVPYLGDPVPFEEDVTRWDKFVERAAEPQRIAASGEVRKRLIESIPSDAPVGIFHGDFQTANLFSSENAKLLAVIDWELTGIGATLNDVGWICTFSDPLAWGSESSRPYFLEPETLITFYEDAHGQADQGGRREAVRPPPPAWGSGLP